MPAFGVFAVEQQLPAGGFFFICKFVGVWIDWDFDCRRFGCFGGVGGLLAIGGE